MPYVSSEEFDNAGAIRTVLTNLAEQECDLDIPQDKVHVGVRGDYTVVTFCVRSGLDTNKVDDIQAQASELLGRRVYCDPQYVAGVAATYRVKTLGV